MHAGTGYDREDPWHGYGRVLRKDTGSMRQAIQCRYKNRGRRYGMFPFSRPRGGSKLLNVPQDNKD